MRRCLLIAALACATPVITTGQARVQDPLVYRAAVAALFEGKTPETIAVGPTVVRLHLPESVVLRGGQVNERLHQYDDIPPGLPERMDALSITPRPATELALPPAFRVLDDSSAALLEAGHWRSLRRRVAAPRGVVHLTPVAYDDAATTALVGMAWDCGPGCRRLVATWLVPDGTGGWRVKGSHRFPAH